MKVYVITKGSYSDYHICAVATDKEKAEKLAEIYTDRWDDAEVEEYDTDATIDVLNGRIPYAIRFDMRLNMRNASNELEWRVSPFTPGVVEEPLYGGFKNEKQLVVRLYALDETTAIKVAAEKAAEFLAQKEGLT